MRPGLLLVGLAACGSSARPATTVLPEPEVDPLCAGILRALEVPLSEASFPDECTAVDAAAGTTIVCNLDDPSDEQSDVFAACLTEFTTAATSKGEGYDHVYARPLLRSGMDDQMVRVDLLFLDWGSSMVQVSVVPAPEPTRCPLVEDVIAAMPDRFERLKGALVPDDDAYETRWRVAGVDGCAISEQPPMQPYVECLVWDGEDPEAGLAAHHQLVEEIAGCARPETWTQGEGDPLTDGDVETTWRDRSTTDRAPGMRVLLHHMTFDDTIELTFRVDPELFAD